MSKNTKKELVCVARDTGSLDDAPRHLDQSKVQLLLIGLPLGNSYGHFQRVRCMQVLFCGEQCPRVSRALLMSTLRTAAAAYMQGVASVEMETSDPGDITFDNVILRMKHVFSDKKNTTDASLNMGALRAEYNKRIEETAKENARVQEKRRKEQAQAAEGGGGAGGGDKGKGGGGSEEGAGGNKPPLSPRTLKARGIHPQLGMNAQQALASLREDIGALNWATFEPPSDMSATVYSNKATSNASSGSQPSFSATVLINGGGGGVPELLEVLAEENKFIRYGVMRVAFGTGRFRRTKLVFFRFSGSEVAGVTRNRANMILPQMVKELGPVSAQLSLHGEDHLTTDSIVEQVTKYFVVDHGPKVDNEYPGDKKPTNESFTSKPATKLTTEDYMAALSEEKAKNKDFFEEGAGKGASKVEQPPESSAPLAEGQYDGAESVSDVLGGALSWCLLELRK